MSRHRSSLLALIVAGLFGTARADEPTPAPTETPTAPPTAAPTPAPTDAPTDAPPADPAPTPPTEPAPTTPPADPAPADPAQATQAGPVATIKGSVIDNNTKEGLPAATIEVKGPEGGRMIATELDGTYVLSLPPGTYTLTFSTPEYVEQTRTITVVASQQLELSLNLDPAPAQATSETIEIVDKIDTRKESAVLAVRRAAATVSDALSSQEISRTPDSNAGDAMKRVVAVSVVEGKYVALRGLEGRYVTALLNGVLLPSPEPDRNAVPLDLFPTTLLSTMTVVKSYSAELPAQFGGGTLSIDTSSFPTSFELRLGVSTSANTASTGQEGLTNASARGFRSFLGFDNGDRKLPTEIPRNRAVRDMDPAQTERIGEAMPNVWTPEGETVTPNLGLTAMVGNTTRLGGKRLGYLASGMLRRQFTVREGDIGGVARTGEDTLVQTDRLTYRTGVAESTLGALFNAGMDLSPNDEISVLGLYSHVGEDVSQYATGFNEQDGSDIDVTRLSFVERSLGFAQVHGKHLLNRSRKLELRWQGNIATTSRDELDTKDLVYTLDVANGTRSYKDQPGSGQHFWQSLHDLAGGGGVDARMRLGRAQLRAGAVAQLSSRALGGRRFRFRYIGSTAGVRGLPAEEMFGPDHVGPDFRLEEGTLQEDAYQASLDVYGAYATSEVELHEKVRAIGGVRFERASQEMTNGSRYAVAGLRTEVARDDNDVLPAANLVVSPRPDMNLRAAYSYTLTRPRFRELAPFLFFDYVRRRDISGNPNLKTTHIHNADLRWEWFPGSDEVIAASVFYKQFVDPIEQVAANVNADATFLNAEGGNLIGGEIEARSTLGRLSPLLDRFRVGANVAVMRSRVELGADQMLLTSKSRPLYGQSPFVVNLNLGYAHPKLADINVLYNVIGQRITDVGIENLPDTYEKPVHRIDLVVSRALGSDLKLKLAASNLLNQKVRLEQGDILVNGYAPGVSFSLGLDWTPK
ncbi:MAG: TonB-dependent receptor domain-containing protein [Kofleriaceae bacterium]